MNSGAQRVKYNDKFAIFWGGGLGDLLVIRPLLIALVNSLCDAPYFFTTSTHLNDLFSEFDLNVNLQIIPQSSIGAMRTFHNLGIRFDWLYLGPYPRVSNRILARSIRPRHIWSVFHPEMDNFVGEQVLADVTELGLTGPACIHQPYGGTWDKTRNGGPSKSYLVLHPGAKQRWETTRWPDDSWTALMHQLLVDVPMDLILVGLKSERLHLETLVSAITPSLRARIAIRTDINLVELAEIIHASNGVICHNSGVMHLSAMLKKPTVVATGSSARFWRPPYPHIQHVTSGACNIACNQYRCPVPTFRAKCIRELDPDKMMNAVRKMLQ